MNQTSQISPFTTSMLPVGVIPKAVQQAGNSTIPVARLHTFTHEPVHLATAVLLCIEDFNLKQSSFSAHDITRAVRDAVLDDEFDLVDIKETTEVDGQTVPLVEHNSVRDIVREFFKYRFIPNYEREFGGQFTTYRYQAPDSTQKALPAPISVNPVAAPTKAANALKQPDAAMWNKAAFYMENVFDKGAYPTLKQVQSRLKGYEVTCLQIKDWAEKEGYLVSVASPFHSRTIS